MVPRRRRPPRCLYRLPLSHALLARPRGAYRQYGEPREPDCWPLVRQQLKADVKLALIQSAQTQVGKRNFAGIFGGALTALLAPTVVDSAVDEWVTPEKLVNNEEVVKRRQEQKSFADFVTYAFSPTAFRADLRDPKDPKSPTLTVLMALSGVRWRVVALKLPPPETWLSKPGTRTPSDDAAPVPQ